MAKAKPHKCYIGQFMCNLDDVLFGVWDYSSDGLKAATAACLQMFRNPEQRHGLGQASDSHPLSVVLLVAEGKSIYAKQTWSYDDREDRLLLPAEVASDAS